VEVPVDVSDDDDAAAAAAVGRSGSRASGSGSDRVATTAPAAVRRRRSRCRTGRSAASRWTTAAGRGGADAGCVADGGSEVEPDLTNCETQQFCSRHHHRLKILDTL